MKAFLLFLVSLCSSLVMHAQTSNDDVHPDSVVLMRYAFEITTPKAAITGIMLVKEIDREIIGSMVNEFGVSAIDFIYDKNKDKIKLQNVVGFLNKWYIKMVLKKDIRLALHLMYEIPYKADKNYDIAINAPDGYVIQNKKRKLTYTFNRILAIESGDDTEK